MLARFILVWSSPSLSTT
jgi:dihydroceramidase